MFNIGQLCLHAKKCTCWQVYTVKKLLFGTDPDRNRVTWETHSSELIPCRRKPLRRTRLLRDPAQTQVWSEQVWLNTTFISQGSRSWDKLAVKTQRDKTKLIIITILHIIITTTSILNLRSEQLRQKYWRIHKCINKYWKYTRIFAATKSSKIINIDVRLKYQQIHKIPASHENYGGCLKFWRKIQAENLGASQNLGGYTEVRCLVKIQACDRTMAGDKISAPG